MDNGTSKKIMLEDKSMLAYEIFGAGFPLILLHGNGNDRTYFEHQIPYFAQNFRVIVVDSRGHGQSTNQQDALSYQLMAEDLNTLFCYEKIQSAHILGFSDGANVAMAFAATYPGKVAKLILNAGNYAVKGVKPLIRIVTDIQYAFVSFLTLFSTYFRKRKAVIRLMIQPTGLSKTALKKILAETLVIVGKKDIIKIEHSMSIASAIPHAKFVLIPNQGHLLAQTSPKTFNTEVVNFLMGGEKNR